MTEISAQLFEKLKLQESAGGDEPTKKPEEARETASKHQPANPKNPPAVCTSKRGHSRTESELSDAVRSTRDKHKVSLKAQGPEVRQKKDSQTYGKVHTRHINQLFIRGENVILVNPQPLWFLFFCLIFTLDKRNASFYFTSVMMGVKYCGWTAR